MTLITPIPKRTRDIVEKHAGTAHPGLWLDKYARSFDPQATELGKLQERVQEPTLEHVVKLSQSVSMAAQFSKLRDRRLATLRSCGIEPTSATTLGPLTLHLSRASALENAGICLHPIYGFAYLPGSGLKGMAHAYACEVWLPTQVDRDLAWRHICDVFGTASSPWLKQLAERLGVRYPKDARAGAVVFHDAWPTQWPKLIVDIVNCHHPDYYGASENDNDHPPGDWENPVPVNFLAIAPGVQFEFAVSLRRASRLTTVGQASSLPTDDRLEACPAALDRAAQWLAGALMHLGAGAKTNAGYGAFRIDEPSLAAAVQGTWDAAKQSKARAEFSCTLELVTPAFLAGANHDDPAGCDLRPATLRGALRWWWRTLHAGHVDTATLRRLEAVIWGDTKQGGAVRVTVEPVSDALAVVVESPFKKLGKSKKGDDRLDFNDQFAKEHDIGIGPAMTTQPLLYLTYGMDELVKVGGKRVRRRRWCVWPGAKWRVRVTARAAKWEVRDSQQRVIETISIPASMCLAQARAALWLVAQFGGVGSRARKGFGSVMLAEDAEPLTLDTCCLDADALRRLCKTDKCASLPESDTIDAMRALSQTVAKSDGLEVVTPWKNPWFALDQIGATVQAFAQADASTGHGKHCRLKLALGLPRQIHGPLDFKLPHQKAHTLPKQLLGPHGDRHASPVHVHLSRNLNGTLTVRVSAFPSPHLPNLEDSKQLLGQLLAHISGDLLSRCKSAASRGQQWPVLPSSQIGPKPGSAATAQKPRLPKPGDMVEAVLLVEKTKKGGWRAKHAATGITGPIQNTAEVPADKNAGDTLTLRVQSANDREIAFRFASTADRTGGKASSKK